MFAWPNVEFASLALELEFELDLATCEALSYAGKNPGQSPRGVIVKLASGETLHFAEIAKISIDTCGSGTRKSGVT